ncbi:MAG: flagellar biosynthesis anti-sigma factor FlgM [Gammaproteobacteria bacterium]
MSIDTRFTPAIRNALLEKMQDLNGRFAPDGATRVPDEQATGRHAGTDSVSLSADAQRIHAAVSMTAGQNVFDVERVADIRQALATGTYSIDPARLADKFYRFNANL